MNIPHRIEYAYAIKSVFEELFGKQAWYKLKECTDLKVWKTESLQLLKAVEISIDSTVQVFDDTWRIEITRLLEKSKKSIRVSKSIDELFAELAAAFIRLSFMQLGHMPNRQTRDDITLKAKYWNFSRYRNVQYTQTKAQKESK